MVQALRCVGQKSGQNDVLAEDVPRLPSRYDVPGAVWRLRDPDHWYRRVRAAEGREGEDRPGQETWDITRTAGGLQQRFGAEPWRREWEALLVGAALKLSASESRGLGG